MIEHGAEDMGDEDPYEEVGTIEWTIRHDTVFLPDGATMTFEDGTVIEGPCFVISTSRKEDAHGQG